MPEYIERKTLLETINETVVFTVREGVHLPTSEMRGANKVIDRIKSAPVADVVQVIRCENCKHFDKQGLPMCYGHCELTEYGTVDYGYCWMAEPKEGDGK